MRRQLFILLLSAFWLTEAFAGVAMNARLYDPVTARFLAPDNYVKDGRKFVVK